MKMKEGMEMNEHNTDPEKIFDMAAEEALTIGSKYRDICSCRDDLYDLLDANDWFGLEHDGSGHDLRVHGLEKYWDRIALWLKAYGRDDREKLDILTEEYRWRYPRLCRRFMEYVSERHCGGLPSSWQTLDYLISSSTEDLDRWDKRTQIRLISNSSEYCTAAAGRMTADFLGWSAEKDGEEHYEYLFPARKIPDDDNDAYSPENFIQMAYCVFNKDAWEENHLIEKACQKESCADMWSFTAIHFICGLRASDIQRLPAPHIPYAGVEMRQKILDGDVTEGEMLSIAEKWQKSLELMSMKPNKTSRFTGIPDIKVFIPETLLYPMGIILSIAASYHEEGECFVRSDFRMLDEKRFFGKAFSEACGNRGFTTRRANKAYLQGIEKTADIYGGEGKIKGYMLAALARSHKGGYGTLPETTDIYLRDAAFSGYKPEFILREMFERGIFGFIPVILLEQYAGDDFRRLDVHSQTQLINGIGLTPVQIERITSLTDRALSDSVGCVQEILESVGNRKSDVSGILQKIACGDAGAKQEQYLCLRNAAGQICPYPERSGCIGCGYEIHTKASLYTLMSEYRRLIKKKQSGGEEGIRRISRILETAVMPAVWEIVGSIRTLYPDADIELMLDIIERGMKDDCSCGL